MIMAIAQVLLFQLCQDVADVAGTGKTNHDVQFLQFDIDGVVVLHKENLDVITQDVRPGVQSCGIHNK